IQKKWKQHLHVHKNVLNYQRKLTKHLSLSSIQENNFSIKSLYNNCYKGFFIILILLSINLYVIFRIVRFLFQSKDKEWLIMTTFIQDYYLFFMVVLLSLSILILLRSILGFVGQAIYFAVAVFISLFNIVWLVNVLFAIQIIFALFLIYR